jgi:hypothetical protein
MVRKRVTKETIELAKASSKSIHKPRSLETLDLAKEHVKIAEDLVNEEGKKSDKEEVQKKLAKAEFDLEKTEADLDQLSDEDFDEEIEE